MRLLKADEIECRVGQFSKNKDKYSVLLYKTSRTDMAILDETYGALNWEVTYHTIGNSLYCQISVWDEGKGQWVGKMSNGSESNIEAEKGQASDAFKRAGFMFGIGRELYSAPKIWLDASVNQYDLEVSEIGYDDKNEINRLVIKSDGKVVYQFPKYSKPLNTDSSTTQQQTIGSQANLQLDMPEWKMYYEELARLCPDKEKLAELCKMNGVKSAKEITKFKYEAIKRAIA